MVTTAIFKVSGYTETRCIAVRLDHENEYIVAQKLRKLYRKVELLSVQPDFRTVTAAEVLAAKTKAEVVWVE